MRQRALGKREPEKRPRDASIVTILEPVGGKQRNGASAQDGGAALGTPGIVFLALLVGALEQLGRFLPAQWPRRNLDVSWMMGLELARLDGVGHGSDIVFGYGPWGFLSAPTPLDVSDLVLAGCFRVLAVGLLFIALNLTLSRIRHGVLIAAVLALLVGNGSQSGWVLLLALTVWALTSLARREVPSVPALSAAAGMAALLLQMKLTEGILALVLLVLLTAGRRRWTAGLVTSIAFLLSFALWWSAAGQSWADIVRWLSLGWEIVRGYGTAMGYLDVNFLMIVMVAAAVVTAVLAVAVSGPDWTTRLGLFGAVLFFAKIALSMPDAPHLVPGYAALVAVLAIVLGVAGRGLVLCLSAATIICLCLLLTIGSPIVGVRSLSLEDRSLDVLSSRHDDNLSSSRAALIADLDLSADVVAAAKGHPVSIDPWQISAVWAYGLDWQPLPIFQQYSAYTSTLDETNAASLLSDPDHRVLRERALEHSRNPIWETPVYTMTLLCNFEEVASDPVWTVLARGADRCGNEQKLSSQRVSAGQAVTLPAPGDSVIAVRFVPDARTLGVRLLGLTGIQRRLLRATIAGQDFRVPEGLAGGPLIVGSSEREPVLFDEEPATDISFDRAGVLRIVEIPLVGLESELMAQSRTLEQ